MYTRMHYHAYTSESKTAHGRWTLRSVIVCSDNIIFRMSAPMSGAYSQGETCPAYRLDFSSVVAPCVCESPTTLSIKNVPRLSLPKIHHEMCPNVVESCLVVFSLATPAKYQKVLKSTCPERFCPRRLAAACPAAARPLPRIREPLAEHGPC